MGLIQGDADHRKSGGFGVWVPPGLLVLAAVCLELGGEASRELFRYDRAAIMDGEYWRFISGHLVHLGWPHLALNAAGLLLVAYLVASRFSARQWSLLAVLVVAVIDLGFWFLQPQLEWYVGLSGLLHGLLVAGIVAALCDDRRQAEFWIVGLLLAVKLAYEQLLGPVPGSEDTAGGNVIVAAHLYGAVGGALCAAWLRYNARPAGSPGQGRAN